MAAAFSLDDSANQYLSAEAGCLTLSEALSHENWVYPNAPAAFFSSLQAAQRGLRELEERTLE